MSGGRRAVFLGAVISVAWYVCVLVFWAVQPLSDAVPVGVDYTLKPPGFASVTIDCNRLVDGAPRDATPLPAMKAQPKGSPPLGYQRDPCAIVHHQARIVFGLDTAFFMAAVLGAAWFVFWRPRSSSSTSAAIDSAAFGLPRG